MCVYVSECTFVVVFTCYASACTHTCTHTHTHKKTPAKDSYSVVSVVKRNNSRGR